MAAAPRLISGRVPEPAAGTFTQLKSGGCPGRAAGSGTCSCKGKEFFNCHLPIWLKGIAKLAIGELPVGNLWGHYRICAISPECKAPGVLPLLEALAIKCPAEISSASSRPYSGRPDPPRRPRHSLWPHLRASQARQHLNRTRRSAPRHHIKVGILSVARSSPRSAIAKTTIIMFGPYSSAKI